MVAATVGLLGLAVGSIFAPTGSTLLGLWAIAALVVVYGISLLDTAVGQWGRLRPAAGSITAPGTDPWYAVFLSQILPGLGHLYLQRVGWAVVLLTTGISTALLSQTYPNLLPVPVGTWAIACWHSYRVAVGRSRQRSPIAVVVLGLVVVRLTVGSIPGWVEAAVVQCIVPSESMVPTLQVGDRLFVQRQSAYQPQLQDVVVFQAPAAAVQGKYVDPGDLLVKRVVGLPGQQVWVTDGRVYLNRQALPEPYLAEPPQYEWGPAVVPPDQYFVLGDNRNASGDSHLWGFVQRTEILGRAYKIYWPPRRVRSLVSANGPGAVPVPAALSPQPCPRSAASPHGPSGATVKVVKPQPLGSLALQELLCRGLSGRSHSPPPPDTPDPPDNLPAG